MIQKPFTDIGPADIQALIDNQVPESRALDYKAELVGTRDADKLEFLKDVSAFANAEGGDVLFGVTEKSDEKGKNTGLPDRVSALKDYNHDQEVLRLESILLNGFKPRLTGVRFRQVVMPDGPVLVMRIERGFAGPHMVVAHDHYRFWGRHSRGKYMLDADELRRLFLRNAELPERLRRMRNERIDAITSGETPLALENNPKLVLHVASLRSFDAGVSLDLQVVASNRGKLSAFGRGAETRYNLDGYLCFAGDAEAGRAKAYTQVFRTGALELVDATVLYDSRPEPKVFPAPYIVKSIFDTLPGYLDVLDVAGAGAPFVVLLSLLDVKGYYIPGAYSDMSGRIDRKHVLLPELVLTEVPRSLADTLRPLLDALWQSSGWSRWPEYDRFKQQYG